MSCHSVGRASTRFWSKRSSLKTRILQRLLACAKLHRLSTVWKGIVAKKNIFSKQHGHFYRFVFLRRSDVANQNNDTIELYLETLVTRLYIIYENTKCTY